LWLFKRSHQALWLFPYCHNAFWSFFFAHWAFSLFERNIYTLWSGCKWRSLFTPGKCSSLEESALPEHISSKENFRDNCKQFHSGTHRTASSKCPPATWMRVLPTTLVIYQYSRTNKMHFLYSICYELTASTCVEHYLLISRRRCINNWSVGWLLPVPLQPW
jgi:hypothetical protein